MKGIVIATCRSSRHAFSKTAEFYLTLLAGLGVEGDAHMGATVKHRSRVRRDPSMPNLRQVHLLHAELLEAVAAKGFAIAPGAMGENITTQGIDLLALPRAALLHIGPDAIVEVTGLRDPCRQIDTFQKGLLAEMVERDAAGRLVRKAGIMGVVMRGGVVRPGDCIKVAMPAGPLVELDWV